jgi:NAD(P)-dependent dehydrogenase (short-subunit alcohol dehydrogenase family)
MSLFDLTGKAAIVTGSSRGIGRAIAERLAEHGAKVVISSRKLAGCEEVAGVLNARHGAGTASAFAANISSKEALQALVDHANRLFGRIDVLVCNAASNPYYGPMAGIGDDQFRKILDNNIISNHWLIGMCAPQMIGRKEGSVIIISSIGGLRGSPIIGAYNISKAADFQLARNLAVEYGPHNVRSLGEPRHTGATHPHHAAAPHRRARRDRRCGRVPGFESIELHDRSHDHL